MKGIWKYSDLLPPVEESCKLTLGEGMTPLVKSKQLGPLLGLDNLYFKLELINPTGSYKDRFAAYTVSHLLTKDIDFCLATSSGNTGSALAAYSSAAALKCYLIIVDGAPKGKMQQMQVYGAETLMVKGFGVSSGVTSDVFTVLNATADEYDTSVQISAYRYSPLGMAGVQTIAYEIAESLSSVSMNVFSPAGGGGLTLAVNKGFQTWKEHFPGYRIPRVNCVQPAGNDTISSPLRNGLCRAQEVSKSTTSISGLQVPSVIDGTEVISACRASGGNGYVVPDEEIYLCQEQLAVKEGIFCEPAGAVSLAGLKVSLKNKEIDKKNPVVCIVTGHGFKDLSSAGKIAAKSDNHYIKNTDELAKHLTVQLKK